MYIYIYFFLLLLLYRPAVAPRRGRPAGRRQQPRRYNLRPRQAAAEARVPQAPQPGPRRPANEPRAPRPEPRRPAAEAQQPQPEPRYNLRHRRR